MSVGAFTSDTEVTSLAYAYVTGEAGVTRTGNATASFNLQSVPMYKRVMEASKVLLMLAVVLGVFGNVMTVVIISRLKAQRSTLDHFFLALAVSDLVANLVGPLPAWLSRALGIYVKSHPVSCKMIIYVFNVAGASAVWLLVAVATQRALAVTWPHRVSVLCTFARVRYVIAAIVVFFSLFYSHLFYGMVVVNGVCIYATASYTQFLMTFAKVDLVLFCWLPFAVLAIANALMVRRLQKSVTAPTESQPSGAPSSSVTCSSQHPHPNSHTHNQSARRRKSVSSVTLTALVVSLAFVTLTMPLAVTNLDQFLPAGPKAMSLDEYVHKAVLSIASFLAVYFNSSINFYLYCLTGRRFRREFLRLFRCWSRPSDVAADVTAGVK